jgi:hypothetical protein
MTGELFKSTQMRILIMLLLLMGIIALGSYASLNFDKMEFLNPSPATIVVSGEGEAFSKPDIGTFSFSVTARGIDAAQAQEASGTSINAILAYLTEQEVAEKDIKTQNYNLNQKWKYEQSLCFGDGYCPNNRVEDGYEVSQTVTLKVRDISAAGTIIAGVGERGATDISNLNFSVDDIDSLQAEARAAAITDAQDKAAVLAEQLGVRIVRLASYNEEGGGYSQPFYDTRMMGMEMAEDSSFPGAELPAGEETTTIRVSAVYIVE